MITQEQLKAIQPGQRVTYHIGNLGTDRQWNGELNDTAVAAMTLAKQGYLALFQGRRASIRFDVSIYEYVAVGVLPIPDTAALRPPPAVPRGMSNQPSFHESYIAAQCLPPPEGLGRTQAEVAGELDVSTAAVSRSLRRFRVKVGAIS